MNAADTNVYIYALDADEPVNQADWWITAAGEESLKGLIETVRHCDQVGQSLWSNSARLSLPAGNVLKCAPEKFSLRRK